jgi:hypothetical protein
VCVCVFVSSDHSETGCSVMAFAVVAFLSVKHLNNLPRH